jgi:hypothetical protein
MQLGEVCELLFQEGESTNSMVQSRGLENERDQERIQKRKIAPPLPHYELEDTKYILLCTETRKWREESLCKKWMGLDQHLAFKKITDRKNAVELKNMGQYLFRVNGKWENKIKKEAEELM